MAELCFNGHTRTEKNTRWYKRGRGEQLKRVCLDCAKDKRKLTGKPDAVARQVQRTTELHEDLEDLIRFGATFHEIIQRSGYSSWDQMRKSLNKRGRTDLLEKLRTKRGDVYQTRLSGSVIPGKPANTKAFGSSDRAQWISENR